VARKQWRIKNLLAVPNESCEPTACMAEATKTHVMVEEFPYIFQRSRLAYRMRSKSAVDYGGAILSLKQKQQPTNYESKE
jgi:hypothetical protein